MSHGTGICRHGGTGACVILAEPQPGKLARRTPRRHCRKASDLRYLVMVGWFGAGKFFPFSNSVQLRGVAQPG